MGRHRFTAALLMLTLLGSGSVWACQMCTLEMTFNAFRFLVPWCILVPIWTFLTAIAWWMDGSERGHLGFWEAIRPGFWLIFLGFLAAAFLGLGLFTGLLWVAVVFDRLRNDRHHSRWILTTNVVSLLAAGISVFFATTWFPHFEGASWSRERRLAVEKNMREAGELMPFPVTSQVMELAQFTALDDGPLRVISQTNGALFISCGPDRVWLDNEQLMLWAAESPHPNQEPLVHVVYDPTNGTRSTGMMLHWIPNEG